MNAAGAGGAAARFVRRAVRRADLPVSAPLALAAWPLLRLWILARRALERPAGALLDAAPDASGAALRAWRRRLLSPWFVPDVSAAPDPLDPAPRVLAGAVAAGMRRCAAEGRPVRLLLARAPGADFEIRLDAARARCFVDRASSAGAAGSAPRHAEAALPPFTCGAGPAAFLLAEDGDDLRLELRPAGGGRGVAVRQA